MNKQEYELARKNMMQHFGQQEYKEALKYASEIFENYPDDLARSTFNLTLTIIFNSNS